MSNKYLVTVLSVEQNKRTWEWQGKKFYDHHIKVRYSNNTEEVGIFSSSKQECSAFVVGQTLEIERDLKQNGQYQNIKYKPVKENNYQAKGKQGNYSFSDRNTKANIYIGCLNVAVRLNEIDKSKEITETMNKLANYIISKVFTEEQKETEQNKNTSQLPQTNSSIPQPSVPNRDFPDSPPLTYKEEESEIDELPF